MRIIKIQVQLFNKQKKSTQGLKYLVGLDRKLKNVREFINHIKKVCKLEDKKYFLYLDDFQLPNSEKVKIIKEKFEYKLRLKKIKPLERSDTSSLSSQNQYSSSDDTEKFQESDCQSEISSKIKIHKSSAKNKEIKSKKDDKAEKKKQSKRDSKKVKIAQKQIIIKKKPQKKMVSESQSSDEQQVEIPEITKQNINQSKDKQKPVLKKTQSITYSRSRLVNKEQGELKNLKNKKNKKQSSSSESQPCSEKLPTCFEKQKQKQKQIAADKKPLPINKSSKLLSGKLRSIIKGSQSSQSEIYEKKEKPVILPEKITPKQSKTLQNTKVISKIPIALRNQTTKKSFNQYQEQKWLAVTKDILKKWNNKGFNVFCQVNNKIRFKTIQLDEQRFIPVKSNWIIGEVKQITQNNKIILTKVYQEGQQFRDHFDIPEHNMQDLQIFQNLATKDQLQVFRQNNKVQQINTQKKIEIISSQLQKNESNDKNSIEKFICGQINFYFSDKNYSTDLYMQMHANRNPQKYINIAFLLNFPKIKKILRDQNKIFQYLTEDENYQKRNYQINMQSRMIRKKNINQKNEDKATPINKVQDKPSSENQQNIEQAQNLNNNSN